MTEDTEPRWAESAFSLGAVPLPGKFLAGCVRSADTGGRHPADYPRPACTLGKIVRYIMVGSRLAA